MNERTRILLGSRKIRPEVASAPAVGLAWLLRLRWILLVGQATTVLVATYLFRAELPLDDLGGLIVLGVTSNATLSWWSRRETLHQRATLIGVLVLDVVLLTVMLQRAGGAANPFTVFYLVHVVLGALLLDTRWALALAAVTSLGFGSLFLGVDPHAHHHHGGDFSAHLQGMWISYALAASLLGAFVVRVARALEARERQIAELQRDQERMERLASIGALAAGAAHELGTPLGTITLLAGELAVTPAEELRPEVVQEDGRLLSAEAARCRKILDRMAARSENGAGEAPSRFEIQSVLPELRAELGEERGSRLLVSGLTERSVKAPKQVFLQVLLNLTQNAFDAIEPQANQGQVRLEVSCQGADLCFCVSDDGPGLAPEAVERLGDPFYTTKSPGRGMGLGLFLSATFAERMGGHLEVESAQGAGTQVRLCLPENA